MRDRGFPRVGQPVQHFELSFHDSDGGRGELGSVLHVRFTSNATRFLKSDPFSASASGGGAAVFEIGEN